VGNVGCGNGGGVELTLVAFVVNFGVLDQLLQYLRRISCVHKCLALGLKSFWQQLCGVCDELLDLSWIKVSNIKRRVEIRLWKRWAGDSS
jgi:hypothetical protein